MLGNYRRKVRLQLVLLFDKCSDFDTRRHQPYLSLLPNIFALQGRPAAAHMVRDVIQGEDLNTLVAHHLPAHLSRALHPLHLLILDLLHPLRHPIVRHDYHLLLDLLLLC